MPETRDLSGREYLKSARLRAGYASREEAAGRVPYSATTIGRHERRDMPIMPQDIATYADAYGAPELPMIFCREDCPIGRMAMRVVTDEQSIALLSVRFGNRMRALAGAANRLADIADDDHIDLGERPEFDRLVEDLRELVGVYNELQLYAIRKPAGSDADGRRRAAL